MGLNRASFRELALSIPAVLPRSCRELRCVDGCARETCGKHGHAALAGRASRAEGGRPSAILFAYSRVSGLPRACFNSASHPTLGAVSALTGLNWGQLSDGARFLATVDGERCEEDHTSVTGEDDRRQLSSSRKHAASIDVPAMAPQISGEVTQILGHAVRQDVLGCETRPQTHLLAQMASATMLARQTVCA